MKKLISLAIIFTLLLSLTSCEKYDPVPSTDEESRVMMTLSLDGESYDVKYELYRAMFLTYKSVVDGGDSSVWSGENKDEYIETIHNMILSRITDIYSALHLAKKIGINMYSNKIDSQIKEYVKQSVEGGVYNGVVFLGYDNYDAYLESLAKLGMNYSVSDLIYRYAIAIDLITNHYAGTLNDDGTALEGGALEYTKDDVKSFYFSDNSVRYMSAFVQSAYDGAYDRASKIREAMIKNEGNDEMMATVIISNSLASATDVKNGTLIGRYNLDEENYGAITEAAFNTALGKVSDIVETKSGDEPGFFILHPISKTEEHFNASYLDISSVYVENEIGKLLWDVQTALLESIKTSADFNSLDYSAITYPTVNRK